jgi:molybdate transport system permease protein
MESGEFFFTPILLSLALAISTSGILLLVGNIFSYWIIFQRGLAGVFLRILVNLPLVLPPTVLGFYFLLLFSPRTFPGSWLQILGVPLTFSFTGLVIASVIFSLPFMVNPIVSSLESLPPAFMEIGKVYGRKRNYIYRKMLLPHVKDSLVAGSMMSFAHTLGEFGLVLMIGGNIQGRTRVASVEIYNRVIALDYQHAHWLSLAMVLISSFILAMVFVWNRKNRNAGPW